MARTLVHPLLAAVLSLATASTQDVLWSIPGVRDLHWFTARVVFLSDLDGDGFQDVAHYSNDWFPEDQRDTTSTMLRSGRDGALMRIHRTMPSLNRSIIWCRAGDFDGDGAHDYVQSYAETVKGVSSIQVRSGRSDAVLLDVPVQGIRHVAGDADFDGDGRPDLMVSWYTGSSYAVDVYRHDGTRMHRLPYRTYAQGGTGPLAAMPDMDGDGCDEMLIGAPLLSELGSVFLVSGRTGAVIRESQGERPLDFIGSGTVRWCGDLDADGVPDYAASSAGASTDGIVIAFSGATGAVLRSWRQRPLQHFGEHFATGDLDRDGVPDFVMSGLGILRCYSGRDGDAITSISPPGGGNSGLGTLGVDIGAVRPDDAFPPIGAIAYNHSPGGRLSALGLVGLYRAVPSNVRTVGVPCAGSFDKPPEIGFRVLLPGSSARIHLSAAPPGSLGFLVLGASDRTHLGLSLPLLLDPVGLRGCLLYNSVDCIVPVVTGTTGIDRGYAYLDVPQAAYRLYAQWIVLRTTPAGVDAATSRGLSW